MTTVSEIIKANEKIYPHTDKRIELNRTQKDTYEFNLYLNDLHESFYTQINEMIVILQSENLMTHQRDKLNEHLIGMTEYFFNRMPLEVFKVSNWGFVQDFDFKMEGKQGVYINPKNFTKDYVFKIVNDLTNKHQTKPKPKDFKESVWFRVGVIFASGKDTELYKQYYNSTNLSKEFKNNAELNKELLQFFKLNDKGTGSYFLNKESNKFLEGTKNGGSYKGNANDNKNAFTNRKKTTLIYNYLKEKQITPSGKFLEIYKLKKITI